MMKTQTAVMPGMCPAYKDSQGISTACHYEGPFIQEAWLHVHPAPCQLLYNVTG
jgi:hypothetical protein